VLGDAVAVHHGGEVGLQFGLAGEELAPVVRRFEAVAVEVVADVHPGTRVGVLPPGAPDTRILLDHRERHPGLLQPDRRQQSGLTAADHDHRELGAGCRAGGQLFAGGRIAGQPHLLEHHRHVLAGHLGGGDPGHHPSEERGFHRRGFRAAAIAVIPDDPECQRAGRGLVLLGHEALHLVEEEPGRSQRTVQDAPANGVVVGHVHAGHQQRGNRHVVKCGGDDVVGVGERLAGIRVAHRSSCRPETVNRQAIPRGDDFGGCRSPCDS